MAWRTATGENDANLVDGREPGETAQPSAGNGFAPNAKLRSIQSNGRWGAQLAGDGWLGRIHVGAAMKKMWIVLV
ncbi:MULTISPECIES: hypothetical protein, partial [unclassified Mycobacteroides]